MKRWKQWVLKDQAEGHQSYIELWSFHKISMMRDSSFWNCVWDRVLVDNTSWLWCFTAPQQHLFSSMVEWITSPAFLGGDRSEGRGDCSSSEEAWGFCGDLAEAVWGACDLERFSKLIVTYVPKLDEETELPRERQGLESQCLAQDLPRVSGCSFHP